MRPTPPILLAAALLAIASPETTAQPPQPGRPRAPMGPVRSPEAGWLRGDPKAEPLRRSGDLAIWRLRGRLDPTACGPANAPLEDLPDTPGA